MTNKTTRYVVWDGITEKPYVETDVDDCMVTHDMQLISVQKLRQEWIDKGLEPVIIFGCESGKTCLIDSRLPNSVFTHFMLKHFDWSTTLRKLISAVNQDALSEGYEQKAEVVCRSDLLDIPMDKVEGNPDLTPVMLILDMCRSRPDDEQGE